MSAQSANVIDLSTYRAQRKAAASVGTFPTLDQYQPFPFHGQAYFFGFWPAWVIAPIPMIGCYAPGAVE
ncbi:hypothetical protein [Rhodopseudomonas sp.]|uniref:hypothetical protein n=1 Tax=Rhodopseudomonas sp. TaxID=1078 RepID=UPI003B3BD9D8